MHYNAKYANTGRDLIGQKRVLIDPEKIKPSLFHQKQGLVNTVLLKNNDS